MPMKNEQKAATGASLADGLGPAVAIPGGGAQASYGQTTYTDRGELGTKEMDPGYGAGKPTGPLNGR